MNRAEFDAAVMEVLPAGKEKPEPTAQEYKKIEYVYTFHPSISETEGKKQIAELYVNFGMAIIADMYPRAEKMEAAERELLKARESLRRAQERIEAIRRGEGLEDGEGEN